MRNTLHHTFLTEEKTTENSMNYEAQRLLFFKFYQPL